MFEVYLTVARCPTVVSHRVLIVLLKLLDHEKVELVELIFIFFGSYDVVAGIRVLLGWLLFFLQCPGLQGSHHCGLVEGQHCHVHVYVHSIIHVDHISVFVCFVSVLGPTVHFYDHRQRLLRFVDAHLASLALEQTVVIREGVLIRVGRAYLIGNLLVNVLVYDHFI